MVDYLAAKKLESLQLKNVLLKYENYFQVSKVPVTDIMSDAKVTLNLLQNGTKNGTTGSREEKQLKNVIHHCINKHLSTEECFDSLHELYGYFELINWEINRCNNFVISGLLKIIISSA